MSRRIKKMIRRITTILMSLCVLKSAAIVTAETSKTYPDIGDFSLGKCEFLAELAEKAAHFRDSGASMKDSLAIVQKANREENLFALAQTAAILAYDNPPVSPQKIREAMMTVCIKEFIERVAKAQGQTLGAMRSCEIDSREHEALLEEVFQLITTDATILATAREQARESMETTIDLLTKIRNNRGWSIEELRRMMEESDSFLKNTQTLMSGKQELLKRNAKKK